MHFTHRRSALLALHIVALVLAVPVAFAAAAPSDPLIQSAVPEPSVLIDAYEGSLNPSSNVTGNIDDPGDDFDWWCLNVTSGVPLTVNISATGGIPNLGLVQGLTDEGDPFQSLGPILTATNNGGSSSAQLTFTPEFSGPATVWVASAGSSFDMDYTIGMSGGLFNPGCGPADIGITKTVNNPTPNVGQNVTYTIVVTNYGPADATGVVVTDSLDSRLNFVSANPGTYNSTTGAWTVGSLASGANATLTITANPKPGTGCQTIPNRARISSADQADNVPGNNSATVNVTVQCADLRVEKTTSNSTPNVGQNFNYTVTVTNQGPNQATNLVLVDSLDSRLNVGSPTASQGSYSPATGLWTVGTLANGATATLTIPVNPKTGNGCQTIPNRARVKSVDQADNGPGTNSSTVNVTVQCADLRVEKTASNSTPNVGQNFNYTVTVTNQGPNQATNLVLVDSLDSRLNVGSPTASQGSYSPATGLWTVGTLANGATATLTIPVNPKTGNGCQTIPNRARVKSVDQADNGPGANSATVNVTAQCADLRVEKTTSNSTPNVGQNFNYTVTVTNQGPNQATNLVLVDSLDSRLNVGSPTASQGSYSPATGLWTVGTLANGATATLTIPVNPKTGNGC